MWEWIRTNWIFVAIVLPLVLEAAKRLYKDCADAKAQRRAVVVDLSGGLLLFEELAQSLAPSVAAIRAYSVELETNPSHWLEMSERLFHDIVSGAVIDECYLDPKALLLLLSDEEARACTVAIETWRRVRMHEVAYRTANDKLLSELSRLRSLPQPPERQTPVVAELTSRLGEELAIIERLSLRYSDEARSALAVLSGDLGSIDRRL